MGSLSSGPWVEADLPLGRESCCSLFSVHWWPGQSRPGPPTGLPEQFLCRSKNGCFCLKLVCSFAPEVAVGPAHNCVKVS